MRRFCGLGLRTPLLHFVALGASLFALNRWWSAHTTDEPATIVVSAEAVASVRRGWHEQFGRAPRPAEERALLADAIDEEILYREALASGYDRDNRIVRARLVDLARFLDVAPAGDPDALVSAAQHLGLERRDVIVRRHLAEMARLALAKGSRVEAPSEAEVRAYFERNAERFAQPARVRLTHVYLSAQRRGGSIDDQAARLLGELRGHAADPREAAALGDPFIHGAYVPLASRGEIERLFGADFAAVVDQAETLTWVGPVRSSYGVHLVWVHERIAPQIPAYDAVRNQVVHALLRERSAQRLEERLARLRERYRIVTPE